MKEKRESSNKKYLAIILILFITLISGIVIAETNPSIFGHEPEEFNGFSWTGSSQSDNVGELTFSNTPLERGHSTSEIEDVVWFGKEGAILKEGAFAQVESLIFYKNPSSGQITSYVRSILTSKLNPNDLSQACYVLDLTVKKSSIDISKDYSSGWSCYPQELDFSILSNAVFQWGSTTGPWFNVNYESISYKDTSKYIGYTLKVIDSNKKVHYEEEVKSLWRT